MADQTIEFFNRITGASIKPAGHFVMDNVVWRDNFESYESQSAAVGFDDFVVECPDIGWRVVGVPEEGDAKEKVTATCALRWPGDRK